MIVVTGASGLGRRQPRARIAITGTSRACAGASRPPRIGWAGRGNRLRRLERPRFAWVAYHLASTIYIRMALSPPLYFGDAGWGSRRDGVLSNLIKNTPA